MNTTRTTYKRIGYLLVTLALLIAAVTFTRAFIYSPDNEDVTANVSSTGVVADTQSETKNTSLPSRLEIPKIGIDAHVQQVGVRKDGSMGVPNNYTDVAWYKLGTLPGLRGSAVISGHQDNGLGTPAVFYKLDQIKVGDDVYIVREDGSKLHFKVIETAIYPYNAKEPLERIFNTSNGTYLNLITCAGTWLQSAHTNDKRLVVYTKLVSD